MKRTPARLVVEEFEAAPCASIYGSRGTQSSRRKLSEAFGFLSYNPALGEAEERTPFDIASVTKPVVALTLACLERRGVLSRREPLADVLPDARGTASAAVPLDLLLAHRGGLQAHIRLFEPLCEGLPVLRGPSLVAAANARRPECNGDPPAHGFPPVYSDMGYLLVGAAMEARTGLDLDVLVARELTIPLGIDSELTSARRYQQHHPEFAQLVAPTEDVAFRGGIVRGLVHDENAFAINRDGLSGHAGLFGTARAVGAFGEAILDILDGCSAILSPADLVETLERRPGGSLLAGFDTRSGDEPASGLLLSNRTFGHLGFTGTSVWIDPQTHFVGVLLTNRVHPSREHLAIRKARPRVYDALVEALM